MTVQKAVTVWKDKRLVYMMSTNANPDKTVQVQRKDGDQKILVTQPYNIFQYNKFMGGVDKADQLRSYYKLRMKTRKFYM